MWEVVSFSSSNLSHQRILAWYFMQIYCPNNLLCFGFWGTKYTSAKEEAALMETPWPKDLLPKGWLHGQKWNSLPIIWLILSLIAVNKSQALPVHNGMILNSYIELSCMNNPVAFKLQWSSVSGSELLPVSSSSRKLQLVHCKTHQTCWLLWCFGIHRKRNK